MAQNRLQIRNLFEYAQLSDKQAYSDGKASLVSAGDEIRFHVEISSSPSVFVLSRPSWNFATFNFYGKRDSKRFELENYESKTVEFQNEGSATKRSIVAHEKPEELGRYECALESMEQFLDFVMYLRDLFGARVYYIRFDGDQAHHLARLYSIEMFRECEHMFIFRGILSNEEMRQMLKFRVSVISMCIAEPDFELLEPISRDSFQINYGHWFKGPMLMQLDCESIEIDSLHIQSAHINAFLHRWMKSSNRKLRNMQLIKKCKRIIHYHEDGNRCRKDEASCEFDNMWDVIENWEEEKFDLLKITEGLSSFEQPNAEANVENSLCFKRPTDGMLMTVEIYCCVKRLSVFTLRIKS